MALLVARVYNAGTNTTYFYEWNFDSHTVTFHTANTMFQNYIPAAGSQIGDRCVGNDQERIFYQSGAANFNPVVTYDVLPNVAACCTLQSSDFQVNKTNNTNMSTPTGTITITSTEEDITQYEASINGGSNYVQAVGGAITFNGLIGGTYNILIKSIAGVCSVQSQIVLVDIISYPPLIIAETSTPQDFSPVFYPIAFNFALVNGTVSVKSDLTGTYLESDTIDGRDFFGTKPIFRITSGTYEGVWEVTSVDNVDNPLKFYFDATYSVNETATFVPFGQQIFMLYAETGFNTFTKIADLAVNANDQGVYVVRIEGFLQSVFEINKPTVGDDLNLARKYYVIPRDFDTENTASIRTAVYSAIPSLTPYTEYLTPLGPAPINFINEQTQKGYPVVFSYLNDINKRVTNIVSGLESELITASTNIFLSALPGNEYDVTWIGSGTISNLVTNPSPLPSWLTVVSTDGGQVKLHINTLENFVTGDYSFSDYNEDYVGLSINGLIGCYTFTFYDGATLLFTLDICIYPAQGVGNVCKKGGSRNIVFNLAWINQEGGWSSYVFEGKKEIGRNIGKIKDYKKGRELKKSSVEDVYTEASVSFANKSIRELLFIATMRTSIQAYLFNEDTQFWDIPIYINKDNFPIYQLPFKQVEVNGSFSFLYAEDILVQKQ